MKNFYESKLYHTLQLVFELIKLNIAALICSVPIITIGAVWTGMYASVLKISTDSGSTVKDFFAAFKKAFRRATMHWLLLLAFVLFFLGDLAIYYLYTEAGFGKAVVIIPGVITFFAALSAGFLFPLLNVFKAPFMQTVRISIVFSIKYFLRSFFVLFLNLLPLLLLYFKTSLFFSILPAWLLVAFGLIAYINSMAMRPVVDEINRLLDEEEEGAEDCGE